MRTHHTGGFHFGRDVASDFAPVKNARAMIGCTVDSDTLHFAVRLD
ncbi:hypothetical protein [Burkholderia ubonensis]|nr:hypothetical protein [Burkholderia ubonensis]